MANYKVCNGKKLSITKLTTRITITTRRMAKIIRKTIKAMIHGSSSDEDSVGKLKLYFTYMKIKLSKSEQGQLLLKFGSECSSYKELTTLFFLWNHLTF